MTADSPNDQHVSKAPYDHARLEGRRNFLRFLLKYLGFPLLAKIDRVEGVEKFPDEGPAILMINHIAFIDPIVVLHVAPRNIVPLAKVEVYSIPGWGIFPRMWDVILVQREDVDRKTIKQVFQVLKAGEIVLVAPEGTRGPELKRAKEGVAYLASRADVPVIPVAIEGTKGFPAIRFTSPWHGQGAHVRFGHPFRYLPKYRQAGREELRKMTDEAMYVLAEMLPVEQRGYYSNLANATQETFEWL
ncbi:MAG: lysophospholipid acyltransferase family protein [Chloroflexota bacterium]|nr:lysophospholipid acyltransferase family protein [Chloroflexota bacterium]